MRTRKVAGVMVTWAWLGMLSLDCTPPAPVVASPSVASLVAPVASSSAVALPKLEPCARSLSWGPGEAPRKPTCRDQGLFCKDQAKVVQFPVCTAEVMSRLIDYDQMRSIWGNPPFFERLLSVAVRGYLRRNQLSLRKGQASDGADGKEDTCPGDTQWTVRLEYKRQDACDVLLLVEPVFAEISGVRWQQRYLCWGDKTVACCSNSLVDSEHEVVTYWDKINDPGPKFCTPKHVDQINQVTTFLHRDEVSFDTQNLR